MNTELLLLIWIACSVLAYGLTLGYFEGQFGQLSYGQERQNQGLAALLSLLGPAALVPAVLLSGFGQHGFRWTAPTRAEARAKHQAAYPYIHADRVKEVEGV